MQWAIMDSVNQTMDRRKDMQLSQSVQSSVYSWNYSADLKQPHDELLHIYPSNLYLWLMRFLYQK